VQPGNGCLWVECLYHDVAERAVRDDVLHRRRVQFDLVVVLGERDVPVDDVVEQNLEQPRAVWGIEAFRVTVGCAG
jgi:hypothetical protein